MSQHQRIAVSSLWVAMTILFSGCSVRTDRISVIKDMEEALTKSDQVINMSTAMTLKELKEKTTDWSTAETAKIWFSKAELISKISTKVYTYLDSVKKLNKKQHSIGIIKEELWSYKKNILDIDSSISVEFSGAFDYINEIQDTPAPSLFALQNQIKITENKLVTYCDFKTHYIYHGFDEIYSPLISQNSNYLKPGDMLEILAGIGSFTKASQPKITIDGESVELGEEGFALFRKRVQIKAGIYKIPVKILFFNQMTGKNEIKSTNLEYTVAKECTQTP